MRKYLNILNIVCVIVGLSGCSSPTEFKRDNPLDPNGINYIASAILSINIEDGQEIKTRDFDVTWQGNSTVDKYQYSLNGNTLELSDATSVTLTDLEEGENTFTIIPQDFNGLKGEPTERTFTIDSIQGPGIVFSPRKVTSNTDVKLILENVLNLMSAHIEIVCENNCGTLESFTKKASVAGNGEYIVYLSGEETGRLILDIAFAGVKDGISGTVEIGSFMLNPQKSGAVTIDPGTVRFRDINNGDITINGLDIVRVER